jgi:hypothetical protein
MAALVHLSRILWVQGYPDQAVRTAAAGVDEAAAIDHTFSLGFALADGACPVSAWVGDRAATARFVGMLSARAEKLGLAIWHAYGRRRDDHAKADQDHPRTDRRPDDRDHPRLDIRQPG